MMPFHVGPLPKYTPHFLRFDPCCFGNGGLFDNGLSWQTPNTSLLVVCKITLYDAFITHATEARMPSVHWLWPGSVPPGQEA